MRRWLAGIILGLLALTGAAALWLQQELATPYYGAEGTETFVDIPHGAGTDAIGAALQAGGILHHKLPFLIYVRWTGLGRRLRAGEYRFSSPARPAQVVQRLVQGDVFYRTITIPEGLTAQETVALIARSGLGNEKEMDELLGRVDWISDLDPRAASLEGYLFPNTYRFSRHTTPEEMLKAMVVEFRTRFSTMRAADPLPPGWTIAQIVTLASMIEKEAKADDERRLVASVLTNRLRAKMPLACDPTIIYALKLAGTYHGNLRKEDLGISSPYNSYVHPGLPPGPIANPGAASLQAALGPAVSDYFYYVSRNDGTHAFSRNLRSHLLAVARYQKRRQSRHE
ncbi:MAG: endolytic transglycosylase MltG [Acidobacteriia bacterium]|nr:endolytic transglycosylase MltG [Terriglobia bacterium]